MVKVEPSRFTQFTWTNAGSIIMEPTDKPTWELFYSPLLAQMEPHVTSWDFSSSQIGVSLCRVRTSILSFQMEYKLFCWPTCEWHQSSYLGAGLPGFGADGLGSLPAASGQVKDGGGGHVGSFSILCIVVAAGGQTTLGETSWHAVIWWRCLREWFGWAETKKRMEL